MGGVLQRLTVSTRVLLSVCTVLLMTMVLAWLSLNASMSSHAGFTQYREFARDSVLASKVEASVLRVRLAAKDFLLKHSQDSRVLFEREWQVLQSLMQSAETEIDNSQRAAKVADIVAKLASYSSEFGQVDARVTALDGLVSTVLDTQGPAAERTLSSIMQSAFEDDDATAAYSSGRSLRSLMLARLYANKFVRSSSAAALQRTRAELQALGERLQELDGELQNEVRRELLMATNDSVTAYREGVEQVAALVHDIDASVHDVLDAIGPVVAGLAREVRDSVKQDQDRIGPALQEELASTSWIIGCVALIAIIIGLISAVMATRPVRKILTSINSLADEAGSGNLTWRLAEEGSSDQRAMAGRINDFLARLQSLVREIGTSAGRIGAQVVDMQATGASLSEAASTARNLSAETRCSADSVAEAMTTSRETLGSVARIVSSSAASVEEMSTSIADVSSIATACLQVAERARGEADRTKGEVGALESSARQIEAVVQSIQEIAEQTNLLALNATIEAARAGESGRGFSVVANEVKVLARQTSDATLDIRERVASIQETSRGTAQSILGITEVIEEVNGRAQAISLAVQEQREATAAIAESLSQTSAETNAVVSQVEDAEGLAEQIKQGVDGVDSTTTDVDARATQTSDLAGSFSQLSQSLSTSVGNFRY